MKKSVMILLALTLIVAMLPIAVLSAELSDNAVVAEESPAIVPKYPSLTLTGAVEYNIYYTLSNCGAVALEDMSLLIFDTAEGGNIDDAKQVIVGAEQAGSLYRLTTDGIPAKNLGDTLYFRIYAELEDGTGIYSRVLPYNARMYALGVLDSATATEAEKNLLAALMHYGAAAQLHFDYRTDSLMNVCIPPNAHQYSDSWVMETPATLTETGVEYRLCTACGEKESREIPVLTVSSIAVTTEPAKTSYYSLEAFDAAGMVITATLSDGSTMTVSDYAVDKTVLSAEDTVVTVTYAGCTAQVSISVSSISRVSVSQLANFADETVLAVEGLYVGVADEGPSADKEMLLKDPQTDDIIAVRNVTYGAFPDYGYTLGDRVLILATVKLDGSTNTPNKRYLEFSADNGDIATTILSTGNEVTYQLTNTVKVSSWEEMQALFAVGTIAEYSYIEFTGELYFNRYAGSDGVDVSRMHMNAAATGVSGIRPDAKRTVGLRDNVMAGNLGDDWSGLFFDEIPATGSYPGYRLKGTMVALYTGGNNYYFQLAILDDSWVDLVVYDDYDVVKEVAYAYFDQGTQIQYDQTQSRRNINPSPEDATAQNTIYLDCSSYVNAVYQEAFGVNVMDNTKIPSTSNYTNYAIDNPNAVDVIGYWENADYTTADAISGILSQVRSQLQVGDLLVYRHGQTSGSSGHVYIYMGDDMFLHCTGSSYVYGDTPDVSYDKGTTNEKTIGAVQEISAESIFADTSHTRYLFKVTASDTVYNFSLLRPLNRELAPTEETKNRMKTQGLRTEKSVDVGQYNAVEQGGTLTYTVVLNNTSSVTLTDVVMVETLSAGVSYTSGTDGMILDGQTLTWTGTVEANSTVTLTYTVTLGASVENLIESTGTVGGVEINNLINTVSGYTAEQLASVAEQANAYVANGATFADPLRMVLELYADALDAPLFDYASVQDALTDVIDSDEKNCRTDTAISQMLVPNLYGGLDIKSGYVTDCSRSRLVVEEYLAVGDMILAEYGSDSVAFVYLGGGELLQVSSADGTCVIRSITGDAYESTNILVTLIAYDRYAILRPSMTA